MLDQAVVHRIGWKTCTLGQNLVQHIKKNIWQLRNLIVDFVVPLRGALCTSGPVVAHLSADDCNNNAGGMKYHGEMYFCQLILLETKEVAHADKKIQWQSGDHQKGLFKMN